MTTKKNVEERIREHYQASNGEWLVEAGKVKEARLLKEAVERIEALKPYEQKYWAEVLRRDEKLEATRRELVDREHAVAKQEQLLETRIKSVKSAVQSIMTL